MSDWIACSICTYRPRAADGLHCVMCACKYALEEAAWSPLPPERAPALSSPANPTAAPAAAEPTYTASPWSAPHDTEGP